VKYKVWVVGGEDVRMRLPLLRALSSLGYEVGAIGSEDSKIFDENNINYERFILDRFGIGLENLNSVFQLRRIIKKVKPDIIHAFDTKPGFLVPLATIGLNVRVVRTITGMGYLFSTDNLKTKLLRKIYNCIHKFVSHLNVITIFQNPDDQEYFKRNNLIKGNKDYLVRGSGLDVECFLKAAEVQKLNDASLIDELGLRDKKIVIMVARLVKDKGVIEFLEAAKQVLSERSDVIFLLVGPTSTEGKQGVDIETIHKFKKYVKYLGSRSDVANLLANSDIFVLPSYYREGVPRVLLEAGAAGLPIITTNMPGCKEVIIEGQNGWLVNPRDAFDLSDKINQAVSLNCEKRYQMGQLSRSIINEHFTLEKVVKQYSRIYEEKNND
jgi:glycosyltransferase involved in cell wall biosynthesis